MEREHRDASIPGYLGCGLAGGCWDYVYTSIILPVFKDSSQTLYIIYRNDSILKLWNEFQNVPSERPEGFLERKGRPYAALCPPVIIRFIKTSPAVPGVFFSWTLTSKEGAGDRSFLFTVA